MVKQFTNPFSDRPVPLGSLLNAASNRLASELDAALKAAGFADVRAAHAPVFMAIDPAGSSATELASRTKMTKQAVGELIRHLVDTGYLSVSPDPNDGRARRVALTYRGRQAIRLGRQVIDDFDLWLADSIGESRVQDLRVTLVRIVESGPRQR